MPELDKGYLNAPGGGGCDALVDGKGLLEVRGVFAGVPVAKVAAAEAFQGACFFRGGTEFAGDGQRPGVVMGLAAVGGPGR